MGKRSRDKHRKQSAGIVRKIAAHKAAKEIAPQSSQKHEQMRSRVWFGIAVLFPVVYVAAIGWGARVASTPPIAPGVTSHGDIVFAGYAGCTVQPLVNVDMSSGTAVAKENTQVCRVTLTSWSRLVSDVASVCLLPCALGLMGERLSRRLRLVIAAVLVVASFVITWFSTVTIHDIVIWNNTQAVTYRDTLGFWPTIASSSYLIGLGGLVGMMIYHILPTLRKRAVQRA